MRNDLRSVPLGSLGVLRARGADVVPFLQGQLSSDMTQLAADRALLAGYHNPQGRVIALLRMLLLAPDEVLAVLPRELVVPAAQRLGKFILRAKVRLLDDSAQWAISGLVDGDAASGAAPPATAAAALPQALHGVARIDASLALRVAQQPARWLLISPVAQPPALGGCSAADAALWERLAIAAGEPQVYAATTEAFVAQMLNLDVLGAIAFDKGCYTGQEVIARAHYRGRVKRRMQRFLSDQPAQLKPGDSGVLADGRTFRVVRAAGHPDGRCEFLAVTACATVEGAPGADRAADTAGAAAPFNAQMLRLPYSLPD